MSSGYSSATLSSFKPIVSVRFQDGHSFRSLIEYLRSTVPILSMAFYSDRIVSYQANADTSIINHVEIKGEHLLEYTTNPELFNNSEYLDAEGNAASRHIVSIELASLYPVARTIQKKEEVRLVLYQNHPKMAFFYTGRQESPMSVEVIDYSADTFVEYVYDDLKQSLATPNVKLPLDTFASLWSDIGKLKCEKGLLTSCETGLRMQGFNSSNPVTTHEWGFFSQATQHKSRLTKIVDLETHSFQIKLPVIKAMSKLGGVATGGLVKVYNENFDVLRLQLPLGCYGRLIIGLVNNSNN